MAPLPEKSFIFGLPEESSDIGNRTVGDGVFHIISDALVVQVARYEPVLLAEILSPLVKHHAVFHGFVCGIHIETLVSFDDGVTHGYNARIADHAVGLIRPEMPNRKFTLLLVYLQHGIHHVISLFGMKDVKKRHSRPVSVPKREYRIVGERLVLTYNIVRAAVLPVHITEGRGMDHRMIKRGVEYGSVISIRSGDINLRQFRIPSCGSVRNHVFEIPSGKFSGHICGCPFHADRGDRHFHKNLFTLRCFEVHPRIHRFLNY